MAGPANPNPTFHIVVRASADGVPHYEVKWYSRTHRNGQGKRSQVKRRLGPAWIEEDGSGGWRKRRGRPPEGWLDERAATVAAGAMVREVEAGMTAAAKERASLAARPLTFREVAHAWLNDMRTVARVKPSTLRDYEALLREPGTQFKRGAGQSPGRLMAAFGDLDVRAITPRMVGDFLRKLDGELTPRNVNKHRAVLGTIYGFAGREDTFSLDVNPVLKVPKRREAPPGGLDFYETDEVEKLAAVLAAGGGRAHSPRDLLEEELAKPEPASDHEQRRRAVRIAELHEQIAEDVRDADLARILFLTGLRLGEVRALSWRQVDLERRAIVVARNMSAGELVQTPKGGRARIVPLATRAVEVLRRLSERDAYTGPDDLVFGNRFGEVIDDSALRRRYNAACAAAGLRRVTLHGLRHASGSHAARRISNVDLRDFLGHSKLSTTDRYVSARWSQDLLDRLDEAFEHSPTETDDETDETTAAE